MNFKRILKTIAVVLILVLAVLALDVRMEIVHYEVDNPASETPLRIALITDLHSCSYGGEDMSELIEAVRAQNPDLVLFGGDIFDSRRMPEDNAVTALKALGSEFTCYYVSGNHEVRHEKLDYHKEIVRSCGITVLDGQHTKMAVSALSTDPDIYGFDDALFYTDHYYQLEHIKEVVQNPHFESSFNILLVHNPLNFEEYAALGFDLVLSGHVHGGQWRIPGFQNGIYAPDQGIFPKYSGGRFEKDGSTLIISRGLARESSIIPRIFNRPELVIIDIK